MLTSDRQALAAVGLALLVVSIPISLIGFLTGDWGFGIAALVIPLVLWAFILACFRIRHRVIIGMIARRSPLVSSLPDYAELRERGDIPEDWTPGGHARQLPPALVWILGILVPWFWGPIFGAMFGNVVIGLWVAVLLSGTAIMTGLLVLAATQYANRHQPRS